MRTEQFSQTVNDTRLNVITLVDNYLARFNRENDWALFWFEYLCEHRFEKNGWKWVYKRWDQITKERLKIEAKEAKEKATAKAKAEAKVATAEAKAAKAKPKAKAKAKPKANKATSVEPLPTPTITMKELDQYHEKVIQETISYLTCLVKDEIADLYTWYADLVEGLPPFFFHPMESTGKREANVKNLDRKSVV